MAGCEGVHFFKCSAFFLQSCLFLAFISKKWDVAVASTKLASYACLGFKYAS